MSSPLGDLIRWGSKREGERLGLPWNRLARCKRGWVAPPASTLTTDLIVPEHHAAHPAGDLKAARREEANRGR